MNATTNGQDDIPVTADASGSIQAALTWEPLPALTTGTATGSIPENTIVGRSITANGESILEGDLAWTDGTKV